MVTPGGVSPSLGIMPNSAGTTPLKNIPGINKPGDIRSTVEEKTLKIPDLFLFVSVSAANSICRPRPFDKKSGQYFI